LRRPGSQTRNTSDDLDPTTPQRTSSVSKSAATPCWAAGRAMHDGPRWCCPCTKGRGGGNSTRQVGNEDLALGRRTEDRGLDLGVCGRDQLKPPSNSAFRFRSARISGKSRVAEAPTTADAISPTPGA
jgi:hypothetical protein